MEFTQLIRLRRSARGYEKTEINHDDIVKILENAQQAPSWKNRQPSRAYIVETQDLLKEFREQVLPDFNQRSSDNAVLIVTAFEKGASGFEEGQPVNELGNLWGAYDLGLRDAYLILAAKDAGYDTLIMGLRDSGRIREMLQIPESEEIVSVIALGKALAQGKERKCKDPEEVTRFF